MEDVDKVVGNVGVVTWAIYGSTILYFFVLGEARPLRLLFAEVALCSAWLWGFSLLGDAAGSGGF